MDKQTEMIYREREKGIIVTTSVTIASAIVSSPSPYHGDIISTATTTIDSTLAAMVVVEVAVEVATAAAIATAAVAPPPTLRSSCLLSLSASTLLFPSTGAQSVVAVGVRWLKGNRFESGATPIKDKHVS